MRDLWHWLAVYRDDTTLPEYDGDGRGHGFHEIDQSRLACFLLLPQRPHLASAVVRLCHADGSSNGSRLIFFRRRDHAIAMSGPHAGQPVGPPTTLHVIGYQRTVAGRNVQALTFLFPDGSVLVSDDQAVTDDLTAWASAPAGGNAAQAADGAGA